MLQMIDLLSTDFPSTLTRMHLQVSLGSRRSGTPVLEWLKEIRLSVLTLNMVIMMALQINQLQITYLY